MSNLHWSLYRTKKKILKLKDEKFSLNRNSVKDSSRVLSSDSKSNRFHSKSPLISTRTLLNKSEKRVSEYSVGPNTELKDEVLMSTKHSEQNSKRYNAEQYYKSLIKDFMKIENNSHCRVKTMLLNNYANNTKINENKIQLCKEKYTQNEIRQCILYQTSGAKVIKKSPRKHCTSYKSKNSIEFNSPQMKLYIKSKNRFPMYQSN